MTVQKTEDWVEWVEPFGPSNEPVYMRVSVSTAIAYQRRIHVYTSDEEALGDFMTVNWAWRVPK